MLRASPLRGFHIPGVLNKIIATLFADDTTTYLSELDDFATLQQLLDTWCSASGAKFNIGKTEIIPIGTEEYRQRVVTTRRMNSTSAAIPAAIHIAHDGEATRSLGAWIGNKIDDAAPWSSNLEKVAAELLRWGRSNPTLRGRRLIVQMMIGGITQYMAKAQGMP
ncbi:hypothetical protein OBBRIDRAFT_717744, partial [Obba rivulosa]